MIPCAAENLEQNKHKTMGKHNVANYTFYEKLLFLFKKLLIIL